MDMFTDRIVAQYIGRHARAEECYEEALKLQIFYNAKGNYENNLKGLFSYYKYKNALHYLADTPEILKDMDLMKPSLNTAKGTRATAPINAWGRQLQVSWMLSPIQIDEENDIKLLNLHKIRSIRYLEECLVWNPDGNFDTVSAMGMLFIYREEKLRQIQSLKEDDEVVTNTWSNSAFFGDVNNDTRVTAAERYFKKLSEKNRQRITNT